MIISEAVPLYGRAASALLLADVLAEQGSWNVLENVDTAARSSPLQNRRALERLRVYLVLLKTLRYTDLAGAQMVEEAFQHGPPALLGLTNSLDLLPGGRTRSDRQEVRRVIDLALAFYRACPDGRLARLLLFAVHRRSRQPAGGFTCGARRPWTAERGPPLQHLRLVGSLTSAAAAPPRRVLGAATA